MPHGKNEYLPLRVHSDFTKGRRGREETHVHPSKRCSPGIKHDRRRNRQNDQNSLAASASSGSTSRGTRPETSFYPALFWSIILSTQLGFGGSIISLRM